ncbi:hypothetical protein [Ruegeria faecimaris]|uniref:hypothetical protein n=1 Tax=Ruegeria faecimaris TaxID=686389 RepID=UPI00232EA56A|nr:hypothetical protein [Ruegeria faecimaris]
MLDFAYLITCVLIAYAGIKFVLWVIKRNLPVPLGGFMWLRFFFWWSISLIVAVAVYFGAIAASGLLLFDIWGLGERLESSVILVGGLILSAPYWVGLIKGIDLQVTQRWSQ